MSRRVLRGRRGPSGILQSRTGFLLDSGVYGKVGRGTGSRIVVERGSSLSDPHTGKDL